MIDSEINRFYNIDFPLSVENMESWQHMCGLFKWHISGRNVNMCCAENNIEKIAWPEERVNAGYEEVI